MLEIEVQLTKTGEIKYNTLLLIQKQKLRS